MREGVEVAVDNKTKCTCYCALYCATDELVDSTVVKYSPLDCQRPELLNKQMRIPFKEQELTLSSRESRESSLLIPCNQRIYWTTIKPILKGFGLEGQPHSLQQHAGFQVWSDRGSGLPLAICE